MIFAHNAGKQALYCKTKLQHLQNYEHKQKIFNP